MVYTPYLGNPPLPQPPRDKDGLVRWASDLTTVLYRWITNLAKRSDVKIKTGLASERPPARGERCLWYSIDTGAMDIDPNWEGTGSDWSNVVPAFDLDDRYVNTTGDTMTGVLYMDLGSGARIQMGIPVAQERPLAIAVGSGVNALFQANDPAGETGVEFWNTDPDPPNDPIPYLSGLIRTFGPDYVSAGPMQYMASTMMIEAARFGFTLSVGPDGSIFFFQNEDLRGLLNNSREWYFGDIASSTWVYIAENGALWTAGGRNVRCTTEADSYLVQDHDELVVCNKASAMTVTLPAASGSGRKVIIKSINTGAVTIDGDGTDTIDGSTTQVIYQYEAVQLVDYAAGAWVAV